MNREDIEDELQEIRYQAGIPGANYALNMAIEAARLVGATEAEIQQAITDGKQT